VQTTKTSVHGAINMLGLAKRVKAKILQASTSEVYGDPTVTRAFCYVDDLVDGLVRLMGTPEAVTGPVDLGNPSEFSIRELAEEVIGLIGSSSRIVHMPLPADYPRQRRPDISKANELLDWRPTVPLRDGLARRSNISTGFCKASRRALERLAAIPGIIQFEPHERRGRDRPIRRYCGSQGTQDTFAKLR
jgi:hypothetical protein